MKQLQTLFVIFSVLGLSCGGALATNIDDYTLPYTVDANTVALFHLDDHTSSPPTTPDAVNTSFSAGFRNSFVADSSKGSWINNAPVLGKAAFADNVVLDGGNAMTLEDETAFDATGTQFTIEAWVNPDVVGGTTNHQMIAHKYKNYLLLIDKTTGTLQFRAYNSSTISYSVNSSAALTAGEWQHVAGVFDNGTVSVYINGELAGSGTASFTTMADAGNDMLVFGGMVKNGTWNLDGDDYTGGSWNNDQQYEGGLDEIRISNVARSFVPEPMTLSLLGSGCLLAFLRQRK